jgi:type IV pilus assembly protein PilC
VPDFAYVAVNTNGKKLRGRIEATSRKDAALLLREKFLTPLELKERRARNLRSLAAKDSIWNLEINIGAKVKAGEFAVFTRQMATLIRAGVPLATTVQILSEQTENKALAKVLKEVTSEVLEGNQLSDVTVKHKDIFPVVFTNMIRAGEVSGNLDGVLEKLAVFFEKEHYTREKVKSALTYPIVVTVMSIGVTIFLLLKVVPTFVSMFASFHAALPLPTRIVLAASHFMIHQWYILLGIVILIATGYKLAMRKDKGRYIRDRILLKLPIFGELMTKSLLARLGRTMSSLLTSGVPILQALRLTADVVDNSVINKALKLGEESLTTGQSLSEPFEKHWVFPPLIVHMIKVGESTGTLDYMLTKIADFYEAETEAMVDRMKSLLEPLMIVVLTTIVGTIILAVLTPMFSLYQQVGNMS